MQAFADIDLMVWEKFVCNVTLSAPTATFDVTVGELIVNPEAWAVALGCGVEAWRVGGPRRRFGFDDPIRYVTDSRARSPTPAPRCGSTISPAPSEST